MQLRVKHLVANAYRLAQAEKGKPVPTVAWTVFDNIEKLPNASAVIKRGGLKDDGTLRDLDLTGYVRVQKVVRRKVYSIAPNGELNATQGISIETDLTYYDLEPHLVDPVCSATDRLTWDELISAIEARTDAALTPEQVAHNNAVVERLLPIVLAEKERREAEQKRHKERKEAVDAYLSAFAEGPWASALLRARKEEGYAWRDMAEQEFASELIRSAGLEHALTALPESDPDTGRDVDVETRTTPTLAEIDALRKARVRIEHANQTLRSPIPTSVGLVWVVVKQEGEKTAYPLLEVRVGDKLRYLQHALIS